MLFQQLSGLVKRKWEKLRQQKRRPPHQGLCVLFLQLNATKVRHRQLCLDQALTFLFDANPYKKTKQNNQFATQQRLPKTRSNLDFFFFLFVWLLLSSSTWFRGREVPLLRGSDSICGAERATSIPAKIRSQHPSPS